MNFSDNITSLQTFSFKQNFFLHFYFFYSVCHFAFDPDPKEVLCRIYRVSHIKLDRVNGSKLRFGGQIRKFRKNEFF